MRNRPLHICIVGGGFTGIAGAIACLARVERPFRLTVVEPAASLGRGVAFGSPSPALTQRAHAGPIGAYRPARGLSELGFPPARSR